MDLRTARDVIDAHDENKPSEIAKAVDILYQEFGTYRSMTREIGRSDKFWIVRHRISQLPVGILWKIDEGDIGLEQAYQITRLKQEEDQWRLAIAIIETEGLTAKECGQVVNLVINEGRSITDSLSAFAGIRFDEIHPLLLPLGSDTWVEVCKKAWTQNQKWEDLCYQLVLQGISVDLQNIAAQLEGIASGLRNASSN